MAVTKHWANPTWEGQDLFHFSAFALLEKELGRGTEIRNLKAGKEAVYHGEPWIAGLVPMAYSAPFLTQLRTTCPGVRT